MVTRCIWNLVTLSAALCEVTKLETSATALCCPAHQHIEKPTLPSADPYPIPPYTTPLHPRLTEDKHLDLELSRSQLTPELVQNSWVRNFALAGDLIYASFVGFTVGGRPASLHPNSRQIGTSG